MRENYNFLADKITYVATPNVVIVNKEKDAVSNHTIKLVGVAPCSQEEGDTRIFVYTWNATEAGSKVIMVKASDTDVVVIAVSVLQALQELGLQQLCCTLAEKSKGMLFFHALAAMSFHHSVQREEVCLTNMGCL